MDVVFGTPDAGMTHIKKIVLRVERQNSFAINVYEHLGFRKVRSEDRDIGGGYVCNEYIMERNIITK